ncbi:MAG: M14 family zinc carboxypeptidase, partial [Candidatus Zixiibacteriota bacterium]
GYTAGNTRIQTMVNNMEIYINPLANPDGTYHAGNTTVSGAWRGNANGIDLNRNYPDFQDGPHPDGNSYTIETNAMIAFAQSHNFIISANFHGGAEVFNYPWDTYAALHADDAWYQSIGHQYADTCQVNASPSAYMNTFNDGITNGFAWYEVEGGRQDFMNYWHGCREVTIELSDTKLLSGAQLPAHWVYNRLSLLRYLEQSLYGIKGVVTDAQTSFPVGAIVSVLSHDHDSSEVRCDPNLGNYHRMIAPGNWSLRFSAPGYVSQTVSNIITSSNGVVIVDVQLQPVPQIPVLSYVDDTAPAAISAGDSVAMRITLMNQGGGDATNTQGILSTADSYVTITQNTSAYPLIPELGGTAQSTTDYLFDVSSLCPQNHVVNFRVDVTADGGYTDSTFFALTVGQSVEDFETGNFTQYDWTMGGNAPWTIVSTGQYEGAFSAASGAIGNSQSSTMSVSQQVTTAGNISFYYKVSSEVNWDWLRFYIDGVEKGSWSGSVGWAQASYAVTPGTRTFMWEYEKDGSQIGGSDKAWVDLIVFPPQTVALVITTNTLPDGLVGVPYSQQLTSEGGTGSKTWIDLGDNLSSTGLTLSASGLLSGTPTTAGNIAFTARVTDQTPQNVDKPFSFQVIQCGDADGTAIVTISDAVYLINYIFSGGPAPATVTQGDADCTGIITISDAVYLINYIFSGGSAPCSACK